jgi:hypothetical protein
MDFQNKTMHAEIVALFENSSNFSCLMWLKYNSCLRCCKINFLFYQKLFQNRLVFLSRMTQLLSVMQIMFTNDMYQASLNCSYSNLHKPSLESYQKH